MRRSLILGICLVLCGAMLAQADTLPIATGAASGADLNYTAHRVPRLRPGHD